MDLDLRGPRPRTSLHVRLQPDPALPRRCVLLALSDPHADRDGATGRAVAARLARADQVRHHSRRRDSPDVGELSSAGALHLHRRGVEWPPRRKARSPARRNCDRVDSASPLTKMSATRIRGRGVMTFGIFYELQLPRPWVAG